MFPAFLSNEHPKSILKYSAPHPSSGSSDEKDQSEIVLIFAGLRTQKSWERRCNKQNEPYLPGTVRIMDGLVKIQEEDHEVAFANDTSIFFRKSRILKTSQIAR